MKNARNLFYLLLLFSVLWMSGCAIPRPHIAPNPANPIKTVAVLPMVNNTNDVEAPEKVREMFAAKVLERCYINKAVGEVSQILKDELGITLGSQLDMTNPQELGKKLGVDAVIYGTLFNFEEKTTGVLNIRRVRAGFKLVDIKTGQVVWGRGQGIKSETRMTEGIAGTIAGGASA
ncbi:MAG TPA: GNA1162 family protein, partial [Thermodesulfobacteriota bacterium]|nr:GNA1162 family protein [Thermodesulfobacteriota bacterium]